jgi:hypothetical protein
MKIDPASIRPRIFSAEFKDGIQHFLACEARIFKFGPTGERGKGKKLTTAAGEWNHTGSFEKVLFPVMIELGPPNLPSGPPPRIHICVDGGDRNWTVSMPIAAKMTDHSAACAIAEAWRGIKACHASMESMLPHVEFSAKPLVEYKQASPLWMLNAWLRWDDWNKRGLNNPRRAEELQAAGFKVDAKMIENAANLRRMPKALKDDPLV